MSILMTDFANDDQPVYTTKSIVNGVEEIAYVMHDKEGDWQCLPRREVGDADMAIVSVGQLRQIDGSAGLFFNLESGCYAEKSVSNGEWKIKRL